MKPFFLMLIIVLCASCYRMPEQDEVSTLPNTNNPTLTRQQAPQLMPGVDY